MSEMQQQMADNARLQGEAAQRQREAAQQAAAQRAGSFAMEAAQVVVA